MVRKTFKFLFSLFKSQWKFMKEKGYITILLMYFSSVVTVFYVHYSMVKSEKVVPIGALRGCEDAVNVLQEDIEFAERIEYMCKTKLQQCIEILDECIDRRKN